MKHFHRVAAGVGVGPLMHAIARQPDLWNRNRWRTTYTGTPHGDIDDILLRYSGGAAIAGPDTAEAVQQDDCPVWHPAAARLPQAKPLVLALMQEVGAYQLDRLLVTRLPPGGRILPHADNHGSYVHRDGAARYHVVLQGLPGSMFRCGGEEVCMRTGEIWWFNPHQVHEVLNNSADDRVHLLVDMLVWP